MFWGSSKVKYLHQTKNQSWYFWRESKKSINAQILQYLCKPETFCIIHHSSWATTRAIVSDVHYTRISPVFHCQIFLETLNCLCSPICVLGVPCHTPSIEIRLEDFGTKDIVGSGDVEAMFIVESDLIWCGSATTGIPTIRGTKGEYFRPDPSPEDEIGESRSIFV